MVSQAWITTLLYSLLHSLSMASVTPPNAWDSHIHVIDPEHYQLAADRDYTPKPATKYNASAFLKETDIAHPVIVLPSVYDTNNAVLLDALKYFNGTARGVAVIDPRNTTNATLKQLHDAGVRGLRANFGDGSVPEDVIIETIKQNAVVAKQMNWVIELWIPLKIFVPLHSIIPTLGVRIVADHYAHTLAGSKSNNSLDTIDPYREEGFPEMVDLVRRRLLFVKLSAPYQGSKDAPLYSDLRVVAETLMLNGPEMCVYASDWPHTGSKEGNAAAGGRLSPQNYRNINDLALIAQTKEWAGSAQQVQRLFVDNPRRLWGWDDPSS